MAAALPMPYLACKSTAPLSWRAGTMANVISGSFRSSSRGTGRDAGCGASFAGVPSHRIGPANPSSLRCHSAALRHGSMRVSSAGGRSGAAGGAGGGGGAAPSGGSYTPHKASPCDVTVLAAAAPASCVDAMAGSSRCDAAPLGAGKASMVCRSASCRMPGHPSPSPASSSSPTCCLPRVVRPPSSSAQLTSSSQLVWCTSEKAAASWRPAGGFSAASSCLLPCPAAPSGWGLTTAWMARRTGSGPSSRSSSVASSDETLIASTSRWAPADRSAGRAKRTSATTGGGPPTASSAQAGRVTFTRPPASASACTSSTSSCTSSAARGTCACGGGIPSPGAS